MKSLARRLLLVTLLAVLLYGVLVLYTGYAETRESLVGYRYSTFGLALLLSTFNYGVRFFRWEYYLGRLGVEGVPKHESLLVFLSGFVLTITPGKVGEVFKSAVLAQTHGVAAARTAPIVVAERLTDVMAVVLLIALGSLAFSGGLPWAVAGAAAVGLALTLILWKTPLDALLSWLARRHGAMARSLPRLREAVTSLRVVAAPGALLLPTAIATLGWGAEGIGLYLILGGFGQELATGLAVFFYSTATLAGAIIPVPGGLGVTDTLIQEQLVRLGGVTAGAATASMILIRAATLWWAVFIGFVALGLLQLRFRSLFRKESSPLAVSLPEHERKPHEN